MSDLISRQAMLDGIDKLIKIHFDRTVVLYKARKVAEDLPSVQPEQKTGHWKHINEEEERAKHNGQLLGWMPWYCSECGCGVGKHQTAFCPNCGADMRGDKHEVD